MTSITQLELARLANPERAIPAGQLVLEPIVPAHARKLFADLQAPELYAFIPQVPPPSVETLQARYERWSQRQSPDGTETWLNYAVFRPGCSDYVGTVQATLRSEQTHIAYQVFPRWWRRGFGRAACATLIAHLFESHAVEMLSALADTRNLQSWKLLESLGFHRLRTIENADEFKGSISHEYEYQLRNPFMA